MTSTQVFDCIFCNECFNNKEDLQIHFRKHGDPKFNQGVKSSKSRLSNEFQVSCDKSNEESEVVRCDVCSDVFPTISKAITHKHKVHPDHDAKYFCPWCGKLFTMKHLYNKHIESNHDSKEESETEGRGFHCDYCNVDFFAPSAMVYHNKFFHRQDTELAVIGQSKKLKHFNQEILPIYYCPFCGEEYNNKVNLHKHMGDDHNDENQSPDDVLRCPMCDAVFYHLDAYELHLTFHSADDLYSEDNEMASEITEFSLETVSPIMEKVENEPQEDAESTMNTMGIENFLQQAMNEVAENDNSDIEVPKKVKKHKKHKKSKKAAITLDEFLNMNKDVFGEGIDFQGIEEVPTRVVAKQLKSKRPPPKPKTKPGTILPSSEIDKLKKAGIVVKMKSGNTINALQVKKKPINKLASKNALAKSSMPQNKSSVISTSSDVLSKLFNQSNSQIKMVKKSAQNNLNSSPQITSEEVNSSERIKSENTMSYVKADNESEETEIDTSHASDSIYKDSKFKHVSKVDHMLENFVKCNSKQQDSTEASAPVSNVTEEGDISSKETIKHFINDSLKSDLDNETKHFKENIINLKPSTNIENTNLNSLSALRNISQHVTIKSVSSPNNVIQRVTTSAAEMNDPCSDMDEDDQSSNEEHNSCAGDDEHTVDTIATTSSKSSMNALKHLSHLITVKPLNQPKKRSSTEAKADIVSKKTEIIEGPPSEYEDELEKPDNNHDMKKIYNNPIEARQQIKSSDNKPQDHIEASNSFDALKNLGKHLTIKSLNHTKTSVSTDDTAKHFSDDDYENHRKGESNDHIDDDDDMDNNFGNNDDKIIKHEIQSILGNKTQINFKMIPKRFPVNDTNKDKSPEICTASIIINRPVQKLNKEINSNNEETVQKQSCTNILKHLPNVTAKPVGLTKNQQVTITSSTQSVNVQKGNIIKQSVKKEETKEEIEIFNIDDSDDEEVNSQDAADNNTHITKPEKQFIRQVQNKNVTDSSMDAFRNLSKNITIKSTTQNKLLLRPDEMSGEDCDDHLDDYEDKFNGLHNTSNNESLRTAPKKKSGLQHTLHNLSKHITVKSGNSSAKLHMKSPNIKTYKQYVQENDDSDDDPSPGKVKITEITEDNADIDEHMLLQKNFLCGSTDRNDVVQSPHDTNSDYDDYNEDFEEQLDIETKIKSNKLQNTILDPKPKQSSALDSLKNISKNITIKSLKDTKSEDENESETVSTMPKVNQSIPRLSNEMSIKPYRLMRPDNIETSDAATANSNAKQSIARAVKPSAMNRNFTKSSDQVSTVNKAVTVKTYQSQTVIEEVTTTVTKTIRTVNQTMKQEVRNMTQSNASPMMRAQNIQGMRPKLPNKNFQGIAVRHPTPNVGHMIRNSVPPVRVSTNVRPSNQLVPVRPSMNTARLSTPRMPAVKKNMPSTSSTHGSIVGKPLRISPNAVVHSAKRPASDGPTGPFSCFKKPKESLIPVSEVPTFSNSQGDGSVRVSASSQMSKTNFTSTTKIAKGNSVMTSTHMKSEVSTNSEQLSRLSNMSGLKIMKTSRAKQASHVEERTEINPSNRTTLAAIEKLQQQGLLVKKPRIEENFSDHSNSDVDDDFET